jgi:glycosyltransferase involved in cell wall biosynthesis
MQVLTLATLATLPQARVLSRSLRRHQPDWPVEILLVGRDLPANASREQPRPLPISRELGIDIDTLIARHGPEELTALLLPRLLESRVRRSSGPVLHLPPTVWVQGSLEPLATALSKNSVLFVPRTTTYLPDDGLEPTAEQLESAGRISETIIGLDRTPAADAFLTWWSHYVDQIVGSLDGQRRTALPEERLWLARLLELAPARFGTAVLEDPGCNLSFWNLNGRRLERGADGVRVDGHWPLRFLDLPGFEPDRPYRLNASASRVRLSRSPVLRELCAAYATELEEMHSSNLDRKRDIGRKLGNGLIYDQVMDQLRMVGEALGERFDDPFGATGFRTFLAWLDGPAPVGRELGLTRYLYYRIVRERPDVMRAYPQLDGPDGVGFVGWCWTFGRDEMGIPDLFMPPRSAAPSPDGSQAENGSRFVRGGHRSEHVGSGLEDVNAASSAVSSAENRDRGDHSRLGSNESEPAVRVSGYLSRSLGLGAAARAYAQALDAAGVAVSTATVPLHHLSLPEGLETGYGEHGFQEVVCDHPHSNFEILAINADELPDFVDRMGADYFQGPRIGIWGWETNSVPKRWQRAYELVDEIWVYSRFMAENIGAVAPVPVIALPPPVQPPFDAVQATRLDVPDDAFMFLFVFDYLSTIQRKNPVGLIEAFKQAFAPGGGPRLLIKTINAPLRPLAEEEVLWAAQGRPDVHVIDRSLTAAERDGLMAGCDCYVSLHRSEGFGLTLAEAMAIGKPVISTGYSGNLDFMNAHNSYLVDYELGVVGPECEIYPADGQWAEPSTEHAAALMREVVADPQKTVAVAMQARDDVARLLSARTTGAAMRKRLEQLAQGDDVHGRKAISARRIQSPTSRQVGWAVGGAHRPE